MHTEQAEVHLKALEADVNAAYSDFKTGRINERRWDQVMTAAENRREKILTAVRTHNKARGFASCASPDEFDGSQLKSKGVKQKNILPWDMPREDMYAMWQAAKHKQPFRSVIKSKGLANARFKSPVLEGAPYPSGLLPPVNVPELTMPFRYESVLERISDFVPTLTTDAPSIEYLKHSGDTNTPAVVTEGGVKVDVGQQWTTENAIPIKIAGLASASMEILEDFGEFSGYLETDLVNATIDAENEQIMLGTGSPGMTGFIAASNVLSRSYNSSTDSSGIDTIMQAFTDIRVGVARGKADLVILHPKTWDNLRRTKTTTGAFVLAMMDPTAIGELDNIWGRHVLETTWCPEGTAVVLDSNLAARWYVRQSMDVQSNPWGDTEWQTNTVSFRAEERATLAIRYPQAISIVVGLSSDSGVS
jgi:HK97 family phage major capsid protein